MAVTSTPTSPALAKSSVKGSGRQTRPDPRRPHRPRHHRAELRSRFPARGWHDLPGVSWRSRKIPATVRRRRPTTAERARRSRCTTRRCRSQRPAIFGRPECPTRIETLAHGHSQVRPTAGATDLLQLERSLRAELSKLPVHVPRQSSVLGDGHAFAQAMMALQLASHRLSKSQQLVSSQV